MNSKRSAIVRVRDILWSKRKIIEVDELDKSHRRSHLINLDDSTTSKRTYRTEEEETISESHTWDLGVEESYATIVETPAASVIEHTQQSPPQRHNLEAEGNHVRFSSVEVREFPVCMGDNPGSFAGVPVSIEWEPSVTSIVPVDDFESVRSRLGLAQLRLDPLERVKRLKNAGYSAHEIREGTKLVDQARTRRKRTRELLRFAHIFEQWELMKRAVLNHTFHKAQKSREREYLRHYKTKDNKSMGLASTRHFAEPFTLDDSIQTATLTRYQVARQV
eukprot:scaffold5301_cov126-Cylindrotheca_fusiformis.AAC.2